MPQPTATALTMNLPRALATSYLYYILIVFLSNLGCQLQGPTNWRSIIAPDWAAILLFHASHNPVQLKNKTVQLSTYSAISLLLAIQGLIHKESTSYELMLAASAASDNHHQEQGCVFFWEPARQQKEKLPTSRFRGSINLWNRGVRVRKSKRPSGCVYVYSRYAVSGSPNEGSQKLKEVRGIARNRRYRDKHKVGKERREARANPNHQSTAVALLSHFKARLSSLRNGESFS